MQVSGSGLNQEEAIRREQRAEKLVNSYCKGLAEVRVNSGLPTCMKLFVAVTHRFVYEFMESNGCLLKDEISKRKTAAIDFLT